MGRGFGLGVGVQSRLWVAAQFGLIAGMLAWPAAWHIGPAAWALAGSAAALGAWVLLHNRPGNFNIRPEPKARARLIGSGPYRHVRHPMYVALLLGMGAVVAAAPDLPRSIGWLALLGVLHGKAALEERLLMQRWPEYGAYRAKTGRFIPRRR